MLELGRLQRKLRFSCETHVFMFSPNVFTRMTVFTLKRFHVSQLLFSLFTVNVFIFHGYCFHLSQSEFSRFTWQQAALSF